VDLALSIIKVFSIVASALFGALGLLTEYKDSAGKVTKWGRIALGGVLLSALVAFVTQALEGSQATKAAKRARAEADALTHTLSDLVVTAHATAEKQQANLTQTGRLREETLNISRATSASLKTAGDLAISMATSLVETRRLRTQADELLVSTQPLISLTLHWRFRSADTTLREKMMDGEVKISKNAESGQGPSPETPFDVEEYRDTLLPLLSYIARLGHPFPGDLPTYDESGPVDRTSIAVLIPLDDSQNAILSFGWIDPQVSWHAGNTSTLSAGFIGSGPARRGSSVPYASEDLFSSRTKIPTYSVNWSLDPTTLANSIDKMNSAVLTTAKMPGTLRVAIFYDMRTLPFSKGNFGTTYAANLWDKPGAHEDRVDIRKVQGFELSLTANGMRLPAYRLKNIVRRTLIDTYDDAFSTRCTILEFERS